MEPIFQRALWLWAYEVFGTVCQMEFQHGRNRQRVHPNQLWANFVAVSLNAEKKAANMATSRID